MHDAEKREKVISALEKRYDPERDNLHLVIIPNGLVQDALALLKEQRWIPVTIPPEKDGRYLCYYKDEYGECVDFGRYENGDWFVSGVAAYMTIPEPPKEED